MSFSSVAISLITEDQWNQFSPIMEMRVIKKTGRFIFPHLDFKIEGLAPNEQYSVGIHMELINNNSYSYDPTTNEWTMSRQSLLVSSDPQSKMHRGGIQTGQQLTSSPISFGYLQMTHDPEVGDRDDLIHVHSSHKYIPVITIINELEKTKMEFRINSAEFFVVTKYRCKEIAALKMKMNQDANNERMQQKLAKFAKIEKTKEKEAISPILNENSDTNGNVIPSRKRSASEDQMELEIKKIKEEIEKEAVHFYHQLGAKCSCEQYEIAKKDGLVLFKKSHC